MEAGVLQVSKAAMHQLRRDAAGSGGEIAFVDESNPIAAQSGVQGDTGAGYAPTYDQEIKALATESVDISFHGMNSNKPQERIALSFATDYRQRTLFVICNQGL